MAEPDSARGVHVLPGGWLEGTAAATAIAQGDALPFASGPRAFQSVTLLRRTDDGGRRAIWSPLDRLDALDLDASGISRNALDARLEALGKAPAVLGFARSRPLIMGVLNVTPDSFSDGGRYHATDAALAHAHAMHARGADIIDVGGESTRPGAQPLHPEQEQARIMPVIRALVEDGIKVSLDSRHAPTLAAGLEAGIAMLNDVSALTFDPDSMAVAASAQVPVVLMHAQGDPQTMQRAPHYADVTLDVADYLEARVHACAAAGVARRRLIVDPGIGFGKTLGHNLQLLRELALFAGLGVPCLLGASRKSFIAKALAADVPTDDRLPGSLVAALRALAAGAAIVRVHDVAETHQALRVAHAICTGEAARAIQ